MEVFATQGANIWACVRQESDEFKACISSLMDSCNVQITPLFFDLTDETGIKAAYKTIKERGASVDVLVNNAGIVYSGLYRMTGLSTFREMNEINVYGGICLTQYILKSMTRQKSGSIVNIASSAGIDGNAGRSAYNMSKAAVISLTKTLSMEVGRQGIRVNAVAPGITRTDMALDHTPEDVLEREISETALGRIGEPEEIAKVVAFLASDEAAYITGQVIRVDGGM